MAVSCKLRERPQNEIHLVHNSRAARNVLVLLKSPNLGYVVRRPRQTKASKMEHCS